MRLGEALIQSGDITPAQLERALNAQLIYGGHLGTCLIELGYIDEQTLGTLLSRVFNVPYAHRGRLDEIPQEVVAALTQGVVEKYLAIPFELAGRTLRVAMVNPGHLPSLDELHFVSGCRIEPWVSPEVRVFQAMERYYQVPRRIRYIALARGLDEKKPQAQATEKLVAAATQAAGADIAQPLPRFTPIAPIAFPSEADATTAPPDRRKPASSSNAVEGRLDLIAKELCRAEDIAAAIKSVLGHVTQDAARCVFFGVKEDQAFVRDVRGFALSAVTAHKIRFAVTTEPLLELLAGEGFYRGPVPSEQRYRGFFDALQTTPPGEILLLPVHRQDRLAGLLYADGGTEGVIAGETENFLRTMRKFTLCLDLIDFKQRVRTA